MFYNYFIKELTEEEYALLYGYTFAVISKSCNFECEPNYVKFLKPQAALKYLERIKPKLLPEKIDVADSLIKKINEYLNNL